MLEKKTVAAEKVVELGGNEGLPDGAGWIVRIETTHAIESYQAGHDPVPSDLAARANPGRVVVRGVARVTVGIGRVGAEPGPPVTSELKYRDQHR